MHSKLLHIYRNTPSGRETWLQSVYFCSALRMELHCYFPQTKKFLMYFAQDAVQVDLDDSYLRNQATAGANSLALAETMGVTPVVVETKEYTASTLPDVPTNFEFMCCPRVMAGGSSKIGLGHIGPRVRRIVCVAPFPVLIPSPVFKPWQSIAVLFGGSDTAVKALSLGLRLAQKSRRPLDVFTQAKGQSKEHFETIMQEKGLLTSMQTRVRHWHFFPDGNMADNLMAVPHDALVVLGAFGHGLIRELVFGSTMETAQSVLPNNLLVTGPHYAPHGPKSA